MVKGTRLLAGGAAMAAVAATSYFLLRPHDKPDSGQGTENRGQVSQPPATSRQSPITSKTTLNPQPSPLNLLGTVMAGAQEQLSVRQPARIVGVYVKEGQAVRVGQLLVQLDTAEVRAGELTAQAGIRAAQAQADKARSGRTAQLVKADSDITTAQAGLTQAQAHLKQAQLGVQAARKSDEAELLTARQAVRKAEADLKTAQTQVRSLEELAKVGGVARNDLEAARTQALLAQTGLESAQAAVRSVQAGPDNQPGVSFRVANALQEATQAQNGVTQAQAGIKTAQSARRQIINTANADIRAAEAGVGQAKAGLANTQIGNQSARLVSHISGVATNVSAHIGETAQPGMSLVTVVYAADSRIEALVPARQLSLVRVGQSARITLDTRPNQLFAAVVSALSTVAEPDGRAFRVTFHFTSPPPRLRVGQRARIQVVSGKG